MAPMKSPSRQDSSFAGTLSTNQVARRWNLSPKEVRRLLGRQVVAFVQIRGRLRIPLEEVERYEKSRAL